MKPVQKNVFTFNNIKILNMSGNSSFNIGEISNNGFSSTNTIKGLNASIGDHSDSQSIMQISSFDEDDKDQGAGNHPPDAE